MPSWRVSIRNRRATGAGNTISGNTAPDGGGMYICECEGQPSDIVISGNTIAGNSATDGGGIYVVSPFGVALATLMGVLWRKEFMMRKARGPQKPRAA